MLGKHGVIPEDHICKNLTIKEELLWKNQGPPEIVNGDSPSPFTRVVSVRKKVDK